MTALSFVLCVPTYNADQQWQDWIATYQQQTRKADEVIVVDSSSSDQTVKWAEEAGFSVHSIPQMEFNHGGTRNQAVKFAKSFADIVVFMTQDAILASPDSLANLLAPFADPEVATVYGKQLPHANSTPVAAHARYFNYPAQSKLKSKEDIPSLGIKTAFMSNSFAAYRRSVFEELGGFPDNTILAEDMYLTAKMVLAGYKVAYCAEATVFHSHNYTLRQELQRYFDTGVFQQEQGWIQQTFGKMASEGKKFVLSELKFLVKNAPHLLPKALLLTFAKWIGFQLGYHYQKLPYAWCKALSMHKGYWKDEKNRRLRAPHQ
ncbi:N-glycosyltransferase [Aggregatibacter actinomycetemcomitans]|uniref:glycosyltransferase family 2 protein n=1 Tax=Aggregatibacter actinomycetemcomitans TaxID=714 RepID=UPI0001B9F854|nr:glycosyltransferase [Aggregatibacter actinomycetemcomitans]ACX83063.1 rhamnosyltransferase [Aggregatibacter actinomycetemcomitans D11S-1]KOE57973.1 rhamnosyltransferase [Aggregatibacter actinomycetemcomitans serotype c str. AAS4A]KOE60513.1 rhamnosyltransferase [Aggregatibacter actinomycetemcomitans serotype c str. D17P-2]KOE60660.1 rhamnosyltransferase [Aggregatibacter actinomycetemcomitans serotype c str. SCC2302]KYK73346.1 rhamnosyltransferase [Aggregatibacter actinomycetemcomitans serot